MTASRSCGGSKAMNAPLFQGFCNLIKRWLAWKWARKRCAFPESNEPLVLVAEEEDWTFSMRDRRGLNLNVEVAIKNTKHPSRSPH